MNDLEQITSWYLIMAIVQGFEYDPGHSDLDDEQPINISMTLGDYRKACHLLRVSPYAKMLQ